MIHSDIKQAKAQAIHQTLLVVADLFNVTPDKLISDIAHKGPAIQRARNLFMKHLHTQGLSYISIGRIVRRSSDCVRVGVKRAELEVTPEERSLLAVLPAIPSTLVLVVAKEKPFGLEAEV